MKHWLVRHRMDIYCLWQVFGLIALMLVTVLMLLRTGDVDSRIFPLFICWCAVGILFFCIAHAAAIAQNRAAVNALQNQCDPYPLLRWAEDELSHWFSRWDGKKYTLVATLNHSLALYSLGRYHESLTAVPPQRTLPKKGQIPMVYWCNMALLRLALGQIAEAEQCVQNGEALLITCKNQKIRERCAYSLRTSRALLRLEQRRLDGLREEFDCLISQAALENHRVSLRFYAAKLALWERRVDDARNHWSYVSEHGNHLFYKAEADALLASL